MRELKFRAWTGLVMEYRVVVGQLGAFFVQGIDPKDTASLSPFNTIYHESIPIMQFTGLKDKNGKEIYEGDIIKNETTHPLEVYWMGLAWGIQWKDQGNDEESIIYDDGGDMGMDEDGLKYMEIIGNIYENILEKS